MKETALNILRRACDKITSGRWILCVACAFVFAWCSVEKALPPEAIASILSSVFVAYFGRQDRNGGPSEKSEA